ncbi:MAG TPA: Ig-like domain-containing protein [Pirellulaceae bacterium]|nr:Ig-like domain-containing protein [Pirellulaceae bacterium]
MPHPFRSARRSSRRRCFQIEQLESRRLLAFDPSPLEQELLLLANRLRADPQQEFDQLISSITPLHSSDPDVDYALQAIGVNGTLLRSQWNSLTPAPPLAWNEQLYDAAHAHNNAMIAARTQSHQLPGEAGLGDRISSAGYSSWNAIAENIYCYSDSPFYAHAAFAIDWGSGPGNIQSPAGHRINLMNPNYREAGFAITEFQSGNFGPQVVTEDFGNRFSFGNAFVVGAVWDDDNQSGWYNAGEGTGGVTIEFTKAGSAPIVVTSMSAGGYQAQLAAGTYTARAYGGALPGPIVLNNVVVGASNVMLNFVVPDGVAPQASDDFAATVQNLAVAINVRDNDQDADGNLAGATIEIVSSPANSQVTIQQAAGSINFTPPPGFIGGGQIVYRLRDAQGFLSNEGIVQIAVADPLFARHNPSKRFDVDHDGFVAPYDALLIINRLNASGITDFPAHSSGRALLPFYDTDKDNHLSPQDALVIINYLNAGGSSEPEMSVEESVRSETTESATADAAIWLWWNLSHPDKQTSQQVAATRDSAD